MSEAVRTPARQRARRLFTEESRGGAGRLLMDERRSAAQVNVGAWSVTRTLRPFDRLRVAPSDAEGRRAQGAPSLPRRGGRASSGYILGLNARVSRPGIRTTCRQDR
jgi:hypothetical protein